MPGQSLKAFLIDALQVAVDKDEKKRRPGRPVPTHRLAGIE